MMNRGAKLAAIQLLSGGLLALFACHAPIAAAQEDSANDNQPSDAIPKITCGERVKDEFLPWFVSIGIKEDGPYRGHQCGGTILSETMILTAAHCTCKLRHPEQTGVIAGKTSLPDADYPLGVSRFLVHPDFNRLSPRAGGDIMIMVLDRSLGLGAASPLKSAKAMTGEEFQGLNYEASPEIRLTIAGFGAQEENQSFVTKLRKAEIGAIPKTLCNGPLGYDGAVSRDQICAGSTVSIGGQCSNLVADACSGDSGGGLMLGTPQDNPTTTPKVLGIVSWGGKEDGPKCGDPRAVGVYTNTAKYAPWITKCMTDPATCETSDQDMSITCPGITDP